MLNELAQNVIDNIESNPTGFNMGNWNNCIMGRTVNLLGGTLEVSEDGFSILSLQLGDFNTQNQERAAEHIAHLLEMPTAIFYVSDWNVPVDDIDFFYALSDVEQATFAIDEIRCINQ